MSWFGGAFDRLASPFTRSPPGPATVSEGDYSYITNDDLKRAQDKPDVLTIKDKSKDYVIQFPAFSIADGLTVDQVKDAVSEKLGSDVKLTYRGKVLKDGKCRDEGIVNGSILSVESSKRSRTRKKPSPSATPSAAPSSTLTAKDKLTNLRETLESYDQEVRQYLKNPPDPSKRDFEHKRLSETILTQVLLKIDAVDTEGDPEARAQRKELVKDTQAVLKSLDDAQ